MHALRSRWVRPVPVFAVLVLIGGIHGLALRENARIVEAARKKAAAEEAAKESGKPRLIYTCSMDPHIKWDHPGQCPICSMDLIPMSGEEGIAIALQPRIAQLADLESRVLLHRALHRTLRTVGVFEPDATKERHLVSWVGGRLDKLHVPYAGMRVDAGDPVAEIYSPPLLRSRDELLLALEASRRAERDPGSGEEKKRSLDALSAARARLIRFGISEGDLAAMEAGRSAGVHVTIRAAFPGTVLEKRVEEGDAVHEGHVLFRVADLSTLWLVLTIYEDDLPSVRVGQRVDFEAGVRPGQRHSGFITFIEPSVGAGRRAIRVRAPVANARGLFMPGMFVNASVRIPVGPSGEVLAPVLGGYVCAVHPEVIGDEAGVCPLDGSALVAREAPRAPDPAFSCSMECGHFPHDGPCPVCGMAMQELPPQIEWDSEYVCLDHPETSGPEPGRCPDDGKARVRRAVPRGRALALPLESLVTLGSRHFLYVETGERTYEPREVLIGRRSERYAPMVVVPGSGRIYPHLSPVRRGAKVVVSGAAAIDSQLQLQGKLSVFAPNLPRLEALAPAERFLEAYFALGRLLAADGFNGADGRIASMIGAAREVGAVGVRPSAFGAEATRRLVEHFGRIAAAFGRGPVSTLEEVRALFASLGPGVRGVVEDVHARIYGAAEILLFRDPGTGRIWAQRGEKPANPFRGAADPMAAEKLGGEKPAGASAGTGDGGGHAHQH